MHIVAPPVLLCFLVGLQQRGPQLFQHIIQEDAPNVAWIFPQKPPWQCYHFSEIWCPAPQPELSRFLVSGLWIQSHGIESLV